MAVQLSINNPVLALFSLAARATATAWTSEAFKAEIAARGFYIIIRVTALTATPSIVPKLEVQMPDGTWILLETAFTAITNVTGTGYYADRIGEGAAGTVELAALGAVAVVNHPVRPLDLPMRLVVTHADTDSITYQAWAVREL